MSQSVTLKAVGLMSWPNPLSLPPGALRRALNVEINRQGIISIRRGFRRLGALDNPPSALSEYMGGLIALDDVTLKHNPDIADDIDVWNPFPGSYVPPTGERMKFLESNGNLYFTTTAGVFTVDTPSATPIRSGLPQGLDTQLSTVDTDGLGWFQPDSIVGYRHTWKRTDANKNAKQGSPSSQERLANAVFDVTWTRTTTTATIAHTSHGYTTGDTLQVLVTSDDLALPTGSYSITVTGADDYTITVPDAGDTSGTATIGLAYDVSLTVTIPADILVDDVLEIWRTDLSASEDDSPGDEHRLILTHEVTSTDLSTGTITLTDDQDPAFLGANLYTNATLESLAQSNDRPPFATRIVAYAGHTFYFGARQPHQLPLQLLSAADLTADTSSITVTFGASTFTYTAAATEDQSAREFQKFNTGLVSVDVERTAKSLQKIINRDDDAPIYAHYISSENDAPGKLLLISRTLSTTPFTLTCNDDTTTGLAFLPALPETGTTVTSVDNAKPNAAWRSKFGQPEAVPILNTNAFGRQDLPVNGAVSTKEALLVFKPTDGLYSLSGQTDGLGGFNFAVNPVDPTVLLTVPNTLVLLDNASFGYTTQGVLRASTIEPAAVSRPQIEDDLFRLAALDNFTLAHAVAYESAHKLLFFTPRIASDEVTTQAFVYNTSNSAWTTLEKPVSCGHVLSTDDRLYLGHAEQPYVLQERKTFAADHSDLSDEDFPTTISAPSAGTATLEYDGYIPLSPGFVLVQDLLSATITSVTQITANTYTVTFEDTTILFDAGAADVFSPIPVEIEWAPITAGNPDSLKQFSWAQMALDDVTGHHQLSFQASNRATAAALDLLFYPTTVGWGYAPWGEFPWGEARPPASVPIRTMVPRDHQKADYLIVLYEKSWAREPLDVLALALDVRPISTKTERQPASEPSVE